MSWKHRAVAGITGACVSQSGEWSLHHEPENTAQIYAPNQDEEGSSDQVAPGVGFVGLGAHAGPFSLS